MATQVLSRPIQYLPHVACLALVSSTRMATADGMSFKCGPASGLYFHVSLDLETGRVVEETLSGYPLKGSINSIVDDKAYLHIKIAGRKDMQLALDLKTGDLRTLPVPDEPSYAEAVFTCERTELRPVLSHYDDF